MSNFKRKPHAKGCGLCKPHKRGGNAKSAILPKYRPTLDETWDNFVYLQTLDEPYCPDEKAFTQ